MDNLDLIYIATRKSPLALWQAQTTQKLLAKYNIKSELFPVVTTGDKLQHSQLSFIHIENNNQPHHLTTGKGLFIKEVQEALLSKQAQLAVHSMKDLPVQQTLGLVIAALFPRAKPNDVLVLSPKVLKEIGCKNKKLNEMDFAELKSLLLKSKLFFSKPIGTTSSRRQLLMKKLFTSNGVAGCDLNLQVLRGNVDSRLKKVNNNEFSAILLAHAGLERLDLFRPESMFSLPTDLFIPAAAQGVIAVECMPDNAVLLKALKKMNCFETCLSAAIERMVLYFLEGDCNSAIGVHYVTSNENISVLYGCGDIEKSFRLPVTMEDKVELKKIFIGASELYSDFFIQALQSSFALKLKEQMKLVHFEPSA